MSITTVSVTVPGSGDGPIADVSGIVGPLTVQLAGEFSGFYDLLASQDGVDFVAIASFDAGGPEGIKKTVLGTFASVRVRANARPTSLIVCEVSGTTAIAGQNGFGTIASLSAGFSGLTPIVDLSGFVVPTGSQQNTCFLCLGAFQGAITVLGSLDGVEFNPIGQFRVDRLPEGAPAVSQLSPLVAGDNVRYVRLDVDRTTGSVVVTVGGSVPASGSGPSGTAVSILVSGAGAGSYLQGAAGTAPFADTQSNTVKTGCTNVVNLGSNNSVGDNCGGCTAVGALQSIGSSGGSGVLNSVALGFLNSIADGSNSCAVIGTNSGIKGGGSGLVILGQSCFLGSVGGSGNNSSVLIGQTCTTGDGYRTSINIGQTNTLGASGGTGGANIVLIGQSINVPDGITTSIVLGTSLNIGAGCTEDIAIGNGGSIGTNSTGVIAIGTTQTIGTTEGESGTGYCAAIGWQNNLDDSNYSGLAIGSYNQLGGGGAIDKTCVGNIAIGTNQTIGTIGGYGGGRCTAIGYQNSLDDASFDCLVVGSYNQLWGGGESGLTVVGTGCSIGSIGGLSVSGSVIVGAGILGEDSIFCINVGVGNSIGSHADHVFLFGESLTVPDAINTTLLAGYQLVVGVGCLNIISIGMGCAIGDNFSNATVLASNGSSLGASGGVGGDSNIVLGSAIRVDEVGAGVSRIIALGDACVVNGNTGNTNVIGQSCLVGNSNENASIYGSASAIGDNCNGVIAIGTTQTVGASGGSGSNNCVAMGWQNNIEDGSSDCVTIGSFSSVAAGGHTLVMMGQSCTIGSTGGGGCSTTVVIGQNCMTGDGYTNSISIGQSHTIGSGGGAGGDSVTLIGQSCFVLDGISNAIVIGQGSSTTSNNTIVIGSLGDGTPSSIGTNSPNSIVINGTIVANGNNGIAIGGTIEAGEYNIALGSTALIPTAEEAIIGSIAFGYNATVIQSNQCCIGDNAGADILHSAIHDFRVRGYNEGPYDTLGAIDDPGPSGTANVSLTGLSVVVNMNNGTSIAQKTFKAAPLASLPVGSLVVYIDP